MFFSCIFLYLFSHCGICTFLASPRKVPKEGDIGKALSCLLPQAKPPFPMYLSRRALTKLPEHLNLDPVRAKSVPTFLPEGRHLQKNGRADVVEQSVNS